jgi:Asp-tRNA(Asn)/Glu-tRNA(Gln) amidotransferase A subunit family amidase
VTRYLNRLKAINPVARCATQTRAEGALEDAKRVDAFLATVPLADRAPLKKDKPFLGVPFTVKESLEVTGAIAYHLG